MAAEHITGLGLRTEAPKLNPKADFASARLSPQEGFVLSRVDGRTSLGDICMITGLGEAATVTILQKLKAALLIVTSAPMAELPPELAPPSAAKAATFAGAAREGAGAGQAAAPGETPSGSAADRGARPRSGGWPAVAPTTAAARPVTPLRDDEIDLALLADGRDLAEDVKRRVLAFHQRLADLDFFDRLEVETDADRAAIRRAYFRLSKEFHPDRYYGKELGAFREMLGDIFKAISVAFATLSDDAARQAYVMRLRDSAAARTAAPAAPPPPGDPRKPR